MTTSALQLIVSLTWNNSPSFPAPIKHAPEGKSHLSIRVNCGVKVNFKRVKKNSADRRVTKQGTSSKMASVEEEREEGKQTIWGVKLRWVFRDQPHGEIGSGS